MKYKKSLIFNNTNTKYIMLKRFYARSLKEIIAAETQRTVAVNALTVGTKAAVAFVALGTLGVDTTPIVAGVGMVGAAAGFALKDVGSNLISGVIIATSGTFHTGDELVIGTTKGKVMAMDLKYLYLETPEGDLVHVPNSVAVSSTVVTKAGASRKRKEELLTDEGVPSEYADSHGILHALQRLLFLLISTATIVFFGVVFGGLKLIASEEAAKATDGDVTTVPKNEYLVLAEKTLNWCGIHAQLNWPKEDKESK